MKKRKAVLLFGSMLALYPVSYLVASRNGAYDARGPWGGSSLADGRDALAPKWGYDWYAFPDASSTFEKGVEHFYCPLQALDRRLWHRNFRDRRLPPKYPIRNYVDPETGILRSLP
jgi:hypothetical protein